MKELYKLGSDVSCKILETLICDLLHRKKFDVVQSLVLNKKMLHKMFYYFTKTVHGTIEQKYTVVRYYLEIWKYFKIEFESTVKTRSCKYYLFRFKKRKWNPYGRLYCLGGFLPKGIQFERDGPIEKYCAVTGLYKGGQHFFPSQSNTSKDIFDIHNTCKTIVLDIQKCQELGIFQLECQLQEYYGSSSRIFLVENATMHGWPENENPFRIDQVYKRVTRNI